MRDYSNLQLMLDESVQAARERIIYVITAYMDARGLVPCDSASADRTVAFARTKGGWAVFDDCADRLDLDALHGLARCLTSRLKTRAVGIMGFNKGFLIRLYTNGMLRDTFSTVSQLPFKPIRCINCKGHAIRWRPAIRKDAGIGELAAAFLKSKENPNEGFDELVETLCLDKSAKYGFASIEDAHLEGVVKLYYHAANHIRQRWYERLIRVPAKCQGTVSSFLFGKRRLGTK